MKLPLLVLVGPTAVGKTAVSVEVARRVGGEIISGDSMQVYRGLDIGTGKIKPEEMQGVPHHMIDIKAPDEPFSVAEFQKRVDGLVHEIHGRGHLPILAGGTGLYVRAVLQQYRFTDEEGDSELRARLAAEETAHGAGHLHLRLAEVDPAAAAKLHPADLRRIIRALEVYETTGLPISETQVAAEAERRYDDLLIGLSMERAQLYERIERRIDGMVAEGWILEASELMRRYPRRNLQAFDAIGYRELQLYLRGLMTRDEAEMLIKRNTRRFAKRQFTWFRREQTLIWMDVTGQTLSKIVEDIVKLVEGKWQTGVEPHESASQCKTRER